MQMPYWASFVKGCLWLVLIFGWWGFAAGIGIAQERDREAGETATSSVEYQVGELVEVSLFEKWIPAKIVQKVAEGSYRVKVQHEGRRRDVTMEKEKIRRTGTEPLIPLTELREWSDAGGKHKIQARLTELSDQTATLLKPDGKPISIPIAKLSLLDQQLLRRIARTHRAKEKTQDGGVTQDALAENEARPQGRSGRSREGNNQLPGPPQTERGGREAESDLAAADEGVAREGDRASMQPGSPGTERGPGPPQPVEVAAADAEAATERGGSAVDPVNPPEAAEPNLLRIDPSEVSTTTLEPPEKAALTLSVPALAEGAAAAVELSASKGKPLTSVNGLCLSATSGMCVVGWSGGSSGADTLYGVDLRSGIETFQVALTVPQALLDISPDGSRFATRVTRSDGVAAVAIWEISNGQAQRLFDLAFSDDRSIQFARFRSNDALVLITDTGLFGVDVQGESAQGTYQVELVANDIAIAPDQSVAAVVADGGLMLLSLETGEAVGQFSVDGFVAGGVAFRADGTRLAAVGGTQVVVWDLTSGEVQKTIELTQPVRGNTLLWIDDSNVLVAQMLLVNVESGQASGVYQFATAHEPGALKSLSGSLWYGFVSPDGSSQRLVPMVFPSGGSGGDSTAVTTLGGESAEVSKGDLNRGR